MNPSVILGSAVAEQRPDHVFARGPGFPHVTAALLEGGRVRISLPEGPEGVLMTPCVLVIAPGVAYRIASDDGRGWSECWVIAQASPRLGPLVAAWPQLVPGVRRLGVEEGVIEGLIVLAFREIQTFHASAHPERAALAANAWERVMLLARGAIMARGTGSLHPMVQAALDVMAQGLARRHTLASLARAVHGSSSHLAQLFRSQLGDPPMRHLRLRRIEHARGLLLGTDWPIKRIALEVGFDDPFHFSSCFHKAVGRSPRAYRAETSTTPSIRG